MPRYFGTFIAGTGPIVERILTERLADCVFLTRLDGAVEFETAVPYSDLNLFCFNNLFGVLHKAPGADLDGFLRGLPQAGADWALAAKNPAKTKSFRLVTSKENQLVRADPNAKGHLEEKLRKVTGLRVDKSAPDAEFWVLSRSEGMCFFLKRLSRHTAYDKLLHPGELHPELAYMLCRLSDPKHTDVVLDPFCGYGAIPEQRAKRFPFAQLYAFDVDPKPLQTAREKFKKSSANVIFERRDCLTLDTRLQPETVDAVITDPPWGLFGDFSGSIEDFYRQALEQLERVLKPGGRMVLLTAKKQEFEALAARRPALTLLERYDILVSGKKAAIFVLEKST